MAKIPKLHLGPEHEDQPQLHAAKTVKDDSFYCKRINEDRIVEDGNSVHMGT